MGSLVPMPGTPPPSRLDSVDGTQKSAYNRSMVAYLYPIVGYVRDDTSGTQLCSYTSHQFSIHSTSLRLAMRTETPFAFVHNTRMGLLREYLHDGRGPDGRVDDGMRAGISKIADVQSHLAPQAQRLSYLSQRLAYDIVGLSHGCS